MERLQSEAGNVCENAEKLNHIKMEKKTKFMIQLK